MIKNKIFIVIIIIVVIILLCATLPWLVLWCGLYLSPNPSEPIIKYEEFPFELVYELNGDKKYISDVLVCEYEGIGISENVGKHRKWSSRFLSGNEYIELLNINDKMIVYYNPGDPRYYMGDYNGEFVSYFPNCRYVKYNDKGNLVEDGIINADEIYLKYSIKLLSWNIGSPVKNSFTNK